MNEKREMTVLDVERENGSTERCLLAALFKAENGRTYAALLPLDKKNKPRAGAAVELYRADPSVAEDGSEDYTICAIRSDMELELAHAAFTQLDMDPLLKLKQQAAEEAPELAAEDPAAPLPAFTIRGADGIDREWQMVDTFFVGTQMYAALLAIPPAEEPDAELREICLFRMEDAEENGVSGVKISPIGSEEEFAAAQEAFLSRL